MSKGFGTVRILAHVPTAPLAHSHAIKRQWDPKPSLTNLVMAFEQIAREAWACPHPSHLWCRTPHTKAHALVLMSPTRNVLLHELLGTIGRVALVGVGRVDPARQQREVIKLVGERVVQQRLELQVAHGLRSMARR